MNNQTSAPLEPQNQEVNNSERGVLRSPAAAEMMVPPSPTMKTEELAHAIAKAFKDEANLPMYLSLCTRYGTDSCRRAFLKSTEVPDNKIKKSKAALFVYLARKYAQGGKD